MMRRRRGVGLVGCGCGRRCGPSRRHQVAQAQAQEDAQNQQLADLQAQQAQQAYAPPPAAAPAAPAVDPTTAQLQNLANLHTQGILSDEEFAAAKAKLLGI